MAYEAIAGGGVVTNTNIVKDALSYVGKLKYKFGGDDISDGDGDCSDFTHDVFSHFGIEIGANTETQYSKGIAVSRSDIKAGDLVFFKNTYNSGYTDGVSHVGIAVSPTTFVHLSSSGCKVSSLDDRYYNNHYLDARRISGIAYEDNGVLFDVTTDDIDNVSDSIKQNSIGLNWWGDVVRVVVIVLVIIAGVVFLTACVTGGIKNGLNSIKSEINKGLEQAEKGEKANV